MIRTLSLTLLVLPLFASAAANPAAKNAESILQEIKDHIQESLRPIGKRAKAEQGKYADLFDSVTDRTKARQCYARELAYLDWNRKLLLPLRTAIVDGDAKKLGSYLSEKLEFRPLRMPGTPDRVFDGIEQYVWKDSGGKSGSFIDYLSQFRKVEDFSLTIVRNDGEKLWARIDIRGLDRQGWRRNDRGEAALVVRGNKITELGMLRLETVRRDSAVFENVTQSLGIASAPVYLRNEAIRRGGYSISVADLSGDGRADLLLGTSGGMKVWKGGSAGFSEWKVPGLETQTLVKTAIVADFDNDERSDVAVVRFAADSQSESVLLLKNQGDGKFAAPAGVLAKEVRTNYAMPASAADFNGDGMLDLYVGFPGNKDFTFLGRPARENKITNGVFLNDGKGKLGGVPALADFREMAADDVYAHSSLAADFNGDGKQDVMIIDDRGGKNVFLRGRGDGTFGVEIAPAYQSTLGMGAAAASTLNDGKLDLVVTNVNFPAYSRFRHCLGGPDAFAGTGISFFKNIGDGKYLERTVDAGLEWAGEGLAGAEFLDYNNDGFADIAVSNGLWSGTERTDELGSYFIFATYFGMNPNSINSLPKSTTRSNFMEVLAEFRGNALTGKFDAKGERPSMAGYQRKRLFRNNGDGSFTEVGYLAGVDSSADGYVVAHADIDQDGKLDLVYRHGDPGTADHKFPVVEIFRNRSTEGHSLELVLRGGGVGSSTDAAGAEVFAKAGGKSLYRALILNNGSSQSERIVHLGLGAATSVEELEIRWPSKAVSKFRDVPMGRITVQEGAGLKLGANEAGP